MAIAKASGISRRGLRSLVGMRITQAIAELVQMFPEVSRITFAAYRPAPGLDARLDRNSDSAIEIRQTAEQLRQRFGIPFWDAILAISMKHGEVPRRYVELAILHDKSPDERYIEVSRPEINTEKVESLLRELNEGFVLALSSKVQLSNGEFAHIPMMDFRAPPSPKNSNIVRTALKAMGEEGGLLVDSGRSYHFYGLRLLSHEAWLYFMAMGILFSPIVDARYIAHRLADGACRLRIGTGFDKPSAPTIIEIIE